MRCVQFTNSEGLTPLRDLAPTDEPDASLHSLVAKLRSEAYAHTDKSVPRHGSLGIVESPAEHGWTPYATRTFQLPPDLRRAIGELSLRMEHKVAAEATRVWEDLGRPQGDWY